MNYKKYKMNGYNLHIMKTDKFKTVTIKIFFKQKIQKETMTIRRVLSETLMQSSKKYPSRRLLEERCEDLYGVAISSENFKSGIYDVLSFSEVFLNEKYTEPGMMKESLEFLFQIVCNPDIKQNKFNSYGLDLGMRIIKDDLDSFSDYPTSYSLARMLENLSPDTPTSYRNCGYMKDLKKITGQSLYDYYLKVLNEDIMDIFIIGDIDTETIKQLIDEKFARKDKKEKGESHFYIEDKIRKMPLVITEKQDMKQSHLLIGCNFDPLSDFELRYVLNVYSFILGGSGDSILFKNVREKNSLCYDISSSQRMLNGLLIIKAGISAMNYEKVLQLIMESLESMKRGEFQEEDILKAKMIFKNSYIDMFDSPNNIINTYLSHEYLKSDLPDEKLKKIELVTKDMVIDIANKIHVNTIYLLKGDSYEKKI